MNNTNLNSATGGDTIRTIDKSSVKTQVVTLDLGGSGTENLLNGGTVPVSGGESYLNGSTSQLVKTGTGKLLGIFVASSSSGTIKLWDNTSAATTVLVNTFSATAATWYPLPYKFATGLYITVGGTIDYSVSYT